MSLSKFQLSYEISPIILTGGSAASVPGGMIPVISLTQPGSFEGGLFSLSSPGLAFSDFSAHFRPLPGGTLEEWDWGTYPFANQQTAANAVISKPLRISLLMVAPAPNQGGYTAKLAAFSGLKKAIDTHILAGGSFTVATPAYLYTGLLLSSLRDVTPSDNPQVQAMWQWDFGAPLITLAAAQAAQNSLMTKITNGVQTSGDPPQQSGAAVTQGNPGAGAGQAVVPAATPTAGASAGQGVTLPTASPTGAAIGYG